MEDVADTNGGILLDLRRRAGLSQPRLAELSGVSVRTIRTIEKGQARAPHRSTLQALARGLRAGPDEARQLLALARPPTSLRPFSDLIAEGADLSTAMAEADVRFNHARRVVNSQRHVRVAASRRVRSIEDQVVVEAVRDGVDTHLAYQDGDQSIDARLLEIDGLEGCSLVARHLFEPWNAVLFELSLGTTLAKGETHALRFRVQMGGGPPDDPKKAAIWHGLGDSDGITISFSRPVPLHTFQVTFEGDPPTRLWELRGTKTPERVAELSLDAWNSAHLVWQNSVPGTYGIEWAWD